MSDKVRIGAGIVLELEAERIATGRAGRIHPVVDEPHLAVKLHTDGRQIPLGRHFGVNATSWLDGRGEPRLAWPIAPVKDEADRRIGFLMVRLVVDDWMEADDCLSSDDRKTVDEAFDWRTMVEVAARLATLVQDVHEAGFIVADISARNVMVSRTAGVALVDCDDMVDRADRRPNGIRPLTSPGYTAPELLKSAKAQVSCESDAWALGVLVCQLLLDGAHPFEGPTRDTGAQGTSAVDDNVKAGRSRFRRSTRFRRSETFAVEPLPISVLPPDVLELAHRCFDEGRRDAGRRPAPREWAEALSRVGYVDCTRSSAHVYSSHLDACPWCAHHTDPFPARPGRSDQDAMRV